MGGGGAEPSDKGQEQQAGARGQGIGGAEEKETVPGIKQEKPDGEEEEEQQGFLSKDELLDIYGERPENWFHPASLVFAIFGRPAGKDEDVDLGMKINDGKPSGAKRKDADRDSDSASPTPAGEEGPSLSTKGLKLLNGAGGSHSRAEMKKLKHEENSENKRLRGEDTASVIQRRALEMLSTPPKDSKSALELCASVKALTTAVVNKGLLDQEQAQRTRWQAKLDAMEKKLAYLEKRGKGGSEEAQKLEADIYELLDNPVVDAVPAAAAPLDTPSSATPNMPGGNGEGTAGGEPAGGELVGTESGGGMDDAGEAGSDEGAAGGNAGNAISEGGGGLNEASGAAGEGEVAI